MQVINKDTLKWCNTVSVLFDMSYDEKTSDFAVQ